MSEDSRSAGSINFEQGPVTILSGAEGLWSVYVTVDEGTEGAIEHQNVNSFTVISQPNLTVVKTATPTTATPGDLIIYDNVILNAGPGKAHNVIVFFKLGDFSSLNVVYGGAVPPCIRRRCPNERPDRWYDQLL
jgi:hypothetical protein